MKPPPSSFFRGDERIEPFGARRIRKGSPEALRVSDRERIREAFAARDVAVAAEYLDVVRRLYGFIVSGAVEWSIRWPIVVAERVSDDDARRTERRTFAGWSDAVEHDEAYEAVARVLDATRRTSGSLADWQAEVHRGSTATLERVKAGLASADPDWAAIGEGYERWLAQACRRHDLLLEYIWAYASSVADLLGQPQAEECLAQSFHGCSFYDPMWRIGETGTQEEIAATLAENLRAHFSGPGRDGGVHVIEEDDRIRLVVDPCGSGGAMRRDPAVRPGAAFGVFRNPSPTTWMRTDGVPAYCGHCAQNEIESVRRIGYPAWVAEFDPDPDKPCCWTIYKDPLDIPDVYFERIGVRRDPSRFKK